MYQKKIVYYLVAFYAALSFCQSNAGVVNGVGEYSELGRKLFIASLFTESEVTDPQLLLDSGLPVSMNMRITANRFYQRRFVAMWLEGIAVNTDTETMMRQSSNLSRFTQLFQGNLEKNDIVSLRYLGKSGLIVSVNEVILGEIRSHNVDGFFRLLLSTWVGEVPLSTALKKALLSPQNIDSDLLQIYRTRAFARDRQEFVKRWAYIAPPLNAVGQVDEKRTKEKTNENSQDIQRSGNDPVYSVAEVASTGNNTKEPESENLNIDSDNENELVSQVTMKVNRGESSIGRVADVRTDVLNPAALETHAALAKMEKTDNAKTARDTGSSVIEPETLLAINEESLIVRQTYYNTLSKEVLKYQRLPKKAFQKKLEDSLRVSVVIDRDGNLLKVKLLQKSKHNVFNQQAMEAVKKAEPFPVVPDEIAENKFYFSVAMNYRLPY